MIGVVIAIVVLLGFMWYFGGKDIANNYIELKREKLEKEHQVELEKLSLEKSKIEKQSSLDIEKIELERNKIEQEMQSKLADINIQEREISKDIIISTTTAELSLQMKKVDKISKLRVLFMKKMSSPFVRKEDKGNIMVAIKDLEATERSLLDQIREQKKIIQLN